MQDVAVRETREVDMPREKIELLKQTVARGVTDTELQLFLHACKRTGLDPFMKQIHAVKRWSAKDQREVMSIQTGIDGYRLIADRTGCYGGSADPEYEINDEGFPGVARATVTKLVGGMPCLFTASARWQEYCQFARDGKPTSMWLKMPFLMLGKCAEALALRKAFPAELSGVYTHEEMMQAEEPKPSLAQHKRDARTKIGEIALEGLPLNTPTAAQPGDPPSQPELPSSGVGPGLASGFNPDTEWRQEIRNATTEQALNALYKRCPDELKAEIYGDYCQALKGLNKK